MTLEEAHRHIGSGVVYRVRDNWPDAEDGVITSVSDFYVFVRYVGDQHSKATPADRLELLAS